MSFADFFRPTPKNRRIKYKKGKGVLFSNPTGGKKVLFYGGSWLMVVGLVFGTYLYWPIIQAQVRFQSSRAANENKSLADLELSVKEGGINLTKKEEDYFVIIPKILAYSPIKLDVNPFDKASYLNILQDEVVAMSSSSELPGKGVGKMTFLFAHSTEQNITDMRNNAVFYLLGEMKEGDPIFIRQGDYVYTYIVYKQMVVGAKEVEYLNYNEDDKEVLILQTCWPLGTNWKRLLVFAQRKGV
jgi:LPXTG-site transpeptidase (sortase) family protein